MDAGLFLRNPDFQLRERGTSSPSVSFSLNVVSARSRQPVIVTGAVTVPVSFGAGVTASDGTGAVAAAMSVLDGEAAASCATDPASARCAFGRAATIITRTPTPSMPSAAAPTRTSRESDAQPLRRTSRPARVVGVFFDRAVFFRGFTGTVSSFGYLASRLKRTDRLKCDPTHHLSKAGALAMFRMR